MDSDALFAILLIAKRWMIGDSVVALEVVIDRRDPASAPSAGPAKNGGIKVAGHRSATQDRRPSANRLHSIRRCDPFYKNPHSHRTVNLTDAQEAQASARLMTG
jgi:hypothetical protein